MPIEASETDRAEATALAAALTPILDGLASSIFPRSEVVFHNLTLFPNTIVAIGGNITGRAPGGPPTDLGLRTFESGWKEHLIGYRTELPDGTALRSSSLFFHGSSGRAIACLCINSDVSQIVPVVDGLSQFLLGAIPPDSPLSRLAPALGSGPTAPPTPLPPPESFPQTVEELTHGLLNAAVNECGLPVDLMKKRHKVTIVKNLQERGFFAIRDSVDLVATALEVSRHTVYNYLNESDGDSAADD